MYYFHAKLHYSVFDPNTQNILMIHLNVKLLSFFCIKKKQLIKVRKTKRFIRGFCYLKFTL